MTILTVRIVVPDHTQWHTHTHTHTHTRSDSSGRVISSSQRPLPNNTQQSQQTDIQVPGGIRTRNSGQTATADPQFRPRGHRLRQQCDLNICVILEVTELNYREVTWRVMWWLGSRQWQVLGSGDVGASRETIAVMRELMSTQGCCWRFVYSGMKLVLNCFSLEMNALWSNETSVNTHQHTQ